MFPRRTAKIFPMGLVIFNILVLWNISSRRSEEGKTSVTDECGEDIQRAKRLFSNISQVKESYLARQGEAASNCVPHRGMDSAHVYRDLFDYEERETLFSRGGKTSTSKLLPDGSWSKKHVTRQYPGQVPGTAHVVWCGNSKTFAFRDYLSAMSIVRVLQPQKLVFHHSFLPQQDDDQAMYNFWWQELKQSLPNLILRGTDRHLECGTYESVRFGLEQMHTRPDGGVYVGEKTLITHIPKSWGNVNSSSYFGDAEKYHNFEHGIMYSRKGGRLGQRIDVSEMLERVLETTHACVTEEEFEKKVNAKLSPSQSLDSVPLTILPPCVLLTSELHPKDIMNSTSRLAEFTRWLYYGQTARMVPTPGPDIEEELIPNIVHLICIKERPELGPVTWPFNAYISVLSALHVAKFDHMYIHGNVQLQGEWWERLKGENITLVEYDAIETVFLTQVYMLPHNTDIMRAAILMKYGGVYMDWDIIWANPIPRHLRRYPAVFSTDWPRYGSYPGAFNLGVLMGKPGAKFLRLFMESFRYYRDDIWAYNAMLMPYKIWERHPDTLMVDRYLQMICFMEICHPGWQEDDYVRDIMDRRPTLNFTLDEPMSFHFTEPDFPPSMESIETMKSSTDMFGELGRKILRQSGHYDYPNKT